MPGLGPSIAGAPLVNVDQSLHQEAVPEKVRDAPAESLRVSPNFRSLPNPPQVDASGGVGDRGLKPCSKTSSLWISHNDQLIRRNLSVPGRSLSEWFVTVFSQFVLLFASLTAMRWNASFGKR